MVRTQICWEGSIHFNWRSAGKFVMIRDAANPLSSKLLRFAYDELICTKSESERFTPNTDWRGVERTEQVSNDARDSNERRSIIRGVRAPSVSNRGAARSIYHRHRTPIDRVGLAIASWNRRLMATAEGKSESYEDVRRRLNAAVGKVLRGAEQINELADCGIMFFLTKHRMPRRLLEDNGWCCPGR
jgi:hypothetical protein